MENVSNQLEWMNRHFVLLQYPSVKEAVEKALYPSSSEIEEVISNNTSSEDYINSLEDKKDYKEGCCFLAYNLHHRAAVWWGYRCVLNLLRELKKAPHKPRELDDIGKPRPLNIPDWAKMPENVTEPYDVEARLKEFRSYRDKAMAEHKARLETIDPDVRDAFNEALEIVQEAVRKKHNGKDLFDLLSMSCEKAIRQHNHDYIVETENSPLMQAKRELEANLEQMRKETIATVKASLPKVDLKVRARNRMSALDSVYNYIAGPDEQNANRCYQIGNKCPDTPEGLLALCAFWSFGDLMPLGESVVKTPSGLFGNGLNSLMLMMALTPGGEKKFKERFETYFHLGCEIGIGSSNWSNSLEKKNPPHVKAFDETELLDNTKQKEFESIDEHIEAHLRQEQEAQVTAEADRSAQSAETSAPKEPAPDPEALKKVESVAVDEAIKKYISKRFK